VAHQVGYDDPAFFRRLLKRRIGVNPPQLLTHSFTGTG
jgi:hypothetical protein